ncbi:MAG: right-handed parallel beta-helix repeat-containing protein, partial [Planctomycetota bacterium]
MRGFFVQKLRMLLIAAFFVVLGSLQAFGETYYISPSGSDSNLGTFAAPWATIAKANATLVAGDTVLIHAGSYSDQIRPNNSGTSDTNRITYRAYGDGDVIVAIR